MLVFPPLAGPEHSKTDTASVGNRYLFSEKKYAVCMYDVPGPTFTVVNRAGLMMAIFEFIANHVFPSPQLEHRKKQTGR